jgi:phosphoenolpyruvate carboxykinase (ATP)
MIIGLSGTGKTTTTFTKQNESLPVQDDFVALMPGGHAHGTENGCFAKTFSLDPNLEPNIYNAVVKPNAYLENVYQDDAGKVNFFEETYTQNGRAVSGWTTAGTDATEVGTVDYLLILNRNENIIPR